MIKTLLTGGSGRLGTELKKLIPNLITPSPAELDITRAGQAKRAINRHRPHVIVHAAAYTDVARAEKDKDKAWQINVLGTAHMAQAAEGRDFVYISTDYVFDGAKGRYREGDTPNPVNYYAFTKLVGEWAARLAPRHHIIRTSFKPRPFEHPKAFTDMWTSADYVDVMAQKIALAITHAPELPPVVHIGSPRRSVYDLARASNPKVGRQRRQDVPGLTLPRDTSFNLTLWSKLKKQFNHKKDHYGT